MPMSGSTGRTAAVCCASGCENLTRYGDGFCIDHRDRARARTEYLERIEKRKLMNISISCDHRVVDGWDAASFVQALKRLLETPALILID